MFNLLFSVKRKRSSFTFEKLPTSLIRAKTRVQIATCNRPYLLASARKLIKYQVERQVTSYRKYGNTLSVCNFNNILFVFHESSFNFFIKQVSFIEK